MFGLPNIAIGGKKLPRFNSIPHQSTAIFTRVGFKKGGWGNKCGDLLKSLLFDKTKCFASEPTLRSTVWSKCYLREVGFYLWRSVMFTGRTSKASLLLDEAPCNTAAIQLRNPFNAPHSRTRALITGCFSVTKRSHTLSDL